MTTAAASDSEQSCSASSPSASGPSTQQTTTKPKKARPSKARLTTTQKNTNHRDAENKRRDGIRAEQQMMASLVPGAENDAKSDEKLFTKTALHIEEQLTEIRSMIQQADAKGVGGAVKEDWRALCTEEDFGGSEFQTKNADEQARRAIEGKGSAKKTGKGKGKKQSMDGDDED